MANLIKPLGIITYILILLAVLTGLRIIKVNIKWHRLIALLGIIGATIHGLIVLYVTYFY